MYKIHCINITKCVIDLVQTAPKLLHHIPSQCRSNKDICYTNYFILLQQTTLNYEKGDARVYDYIYKISPPTVAFEQCTKEVTIWYRVHHTFFHLKRVNSSKSLGLHTCAIGVVAEYQS